MKHKKKISIKEIQANLEVLERIYDIPSVEKWKITSEDIVRDPVLARKIITIMRNLENDYEK